MVNTVEEMLREYEHINEESQRGPITSDNYLIIIAELQEEERRSHGIVKNDRIIKFLKQRFE